MLSALLRLYGTYAKQSWQPRLDWVSLTYNTKIAKQEDALIVVEGTVRVDPEVLDRARPAMLRMIAASRAETGCIDYAYAQDIADPGLIRVAERWQSRDALAAHFQTAHMAEWRAEFATYDIRDRQLRMYEAEPEDM